MDNKSETIKEKLDKISKTLPIRTGEDGMIKLDRDNPMDVEWYNED